MVYGLENIENLPTLREVVRMVSEAVEKMPVVHRGQFTPIVNDKDSFLLTRTNLMYSLKPNITTQGAIFGWQNTYEYGEPIVPTLFRDDRPNYMVNNVCREDAEIIYESHPLYSLLSKGIIIPGIGKPIQILNPYGISHSYGYPSPFISLTQSIEIAAYHACHKYNEITGETQEQSEGAGVLLVYHLMMPFSMTPGLSTVGRQAFLRPGTNRLFLLECRPELNFLDLPNVVGFQFRHSKEDSKYYSQKFNGNNSLFPHETIADKLAHLRTSMTFSNDALERNLRQNPRDKRNINIAKLKETGYTLVADNDYRFTREELAKEWFDNVEGKWSDFWANTVFANHLGFKEDQLFYLLTLWENKEYEKFFNPDVWFNSLKQ